MSNPTVKGTAVEGRPYREARVCLGPSFAGAYYKFFLTGTSTPAAIYQDGNLTTAFSPAGQATADSYGRFAAIYLDTSVTYKVQLFNSANTLLRTLDPYVTPLATTGTSSRSAYGLNIATTGEMTVPAPNSGGSGVSLTLNAGVLGGTPLRLGGTKPGSSALIVNGSATTGAQSALFAADNKPGSSTSSPAGWLPITCDGVKYYAPFWHGNPFSSYSRQVLALHTYVFSGVAAFLTGTETVPVGASSLEIILDAGGGEGGGSNSLTIPGGGGGGGGRSHSVGIAVSPGQTLSYTLGAPGFQASGGTVGGRSAFNSLVTGVGALSSVSLIAYGGGGGQVYDPPVSDFGNGGVGGTATGGNYANITGVTGTAGPSGGAGGNSGAGAAGGTSSTAPGTPGAGSAGAVNTVPLLTMGGNSQVQFIYT